MKRLLPLMLAICMLGCVQVDQGAQKATAPDLLLGEWVSPRVFMDAQEPTQLKFLANGRVERTEKGKELRTYTYTRQPFDPWAMKEGSAKSIGLASDDPPLQEMFAVYTGEEPPSGRVCLVTYYLWSKSQMKWIPQTIGYS